MISAIVTACLLALVERPENCPPLPSQPAVVVQTPSGKLQVTSEPAAPPSCFNVMVLRWTDRKGTRELTRIGDESMTTAQHFKQAGADFLFVRSSQLAPTAEWTDSQLLWLRPGGELTPVDSEPHAACSGYELEGLSEPRPYGGYFLQGSTLRFRATYAANRPDMAYVSAKLRLRKAKGRYSLAVSSCKVDLAGD